MDFDALVLGDKNNDNRNNNHNNNNNNNTDANHNERAGAGPERRFSVHNIDPSSPAVRYGQPENANMSTEATRITSVASYREDNDDNEDNDSDEEVPQQTRKKSNVSNTSSTTAAVIIRQSVDDVSGDMDMLGVDDDDDVDEDDQYVSYEEYSMDEAMQSSQPESYLNVEEDDDDDETGHGRYSSTIIHGTASVDPFSVSELSPESGLPILQSERKAMSTQNEYWCHISESIALDDQGGNPVGDDHHKQESHEHTRPLICKVANDKAWGSAFGNGIICDMHSKYIEHSNGTHIEWVIEVFNCKALLNHNSEFGSIMIGVSSNLSSTNSEENFASSEAGYAFDNYGNIVHDGALQKAEITRQLMFESRDTVHIILDYSDAQQWKLYANIGDIDDEQLFQYQYVLLFADLPPRSYRLAVALYTQADALVIERCSIHGTNDGAFYQELKSYKKRASASASTSTAEEQSGAIDLAEDNEDDAMDADDDEEDEAQNEEELGNGSDVNRDEVLVADSSSNSNPNSNPNSSNSHSNDSGDSNEIKNADADADVDANPLDPDTHIADESKNNNSEHPPHNSDNENENEDEKAVIEHYETLMDGSTVTIGGHSHENEGSAAASASSKTLPIYTHNNNSITHNDRDTVVGDGATTTTTTAAEVVVLPLPSNMEEMIQVNKKLQQQSNAREQTIAQLQQQLYKLQHHSREQQSTLERGARTEREYVQRIERLQTELEVSRAQTQAQIEAAAAAAATVASTEPESSMGLQHRSNNSNSSSHSNKSRKSESSAAGGKELKLLQQSEALRNENERLKHELQLAQERCQNFESYKVELRQSWETKLEDCIRSKLQLIQTTSAEIDRYRVLCKQIAQQTMSISYRRSKQLNHSHNNSHNSHSHHNNNNNHNNNNDNRNGTHNHEHRLANGFV